VRYSIVVKTTEGITSVVDQDASDQLVIQQVLAGKRDAFRLLITRYSDPLYRHALCMTGSPDVAEDVLQTSFIKAYQHLSEVRGRFDAPEQFGLIDDIRPQTSGFFQLRSSLSAGEEETRGFGHRARHAAAGLLDQLGRTLARERGQRPRDDDSQSFEGTARAGRAWLGEVHLGAAELADEGPRRFVREKRHDGPGDDRADAPNRDDFLL